jgi:hypothetical protein
MRMPTPLDQLYAWHAKAMRGLEPVIDNTPQCGWYKRKLVKGGVFVPARIWMFQDIDAETGELLSDELLQCEVNGTYADPEDAWSWICSNPITEQEFRYLSARIDFALRNEPDDPFAAPTQPIDLNRSPILF